MDILVEKLEHLRQRLSIQVDILRLMRNISLPIVIACGVLVWMGIVRAFRWRRYHAIHREYEPKWKNGRGNITPEEAQQILKVSVTYDMPTVLMKSIGVALFKTYGIPSISRLLCATKELKSKETTSKRYADTGILISTFFGCPISGFFDPNFHLTNVGPNQKPAEDPRAMIALARTNYLHSKYKITNDDYLYTLSLFCGEPNTWANRYGWRKLSPLERYAYHVYWAEIGRRMGIQNIPDSFESLEEWSKEYERKYMIPASSNHELAGYTFDEILAVVPHALGLRTLGIKFVFCLTDDNVREAMMYPKQPLALKIFVRGLLASVGLIQRWFLLPRRSPAPFPVDLSSYEVGKHGKCPRLYPNIWAARPWYKPEPRNFLIYLKDKFLVMIGWHFEMPGTHLRSSGYRIEELGPIKFENAGHEEVMREAARLQGCPITGPWSGEGRKGI